MPVPLPNGVIIVMPSYNSEVFIDRSISSVLNQSHQNVSLVVVDDCSVDRTVEVIEEMAKLDSRLSLVKLSDGRGGPAKPRNIGLVRDKGDYVAFIDSDDIWHQGKLALQIEAMEKNNLNFLSTRHQCFSAEQHLDVDGEQGLGVIKRITHNDILKKNKIVTSSVIMTAELANHLHFPEEEENFGVEDYWAWLRLFQRSDVRAGILSNPLVYYRLRKNSLSSSKILMARKIFGLLSRYEIAGKPLGFRKYGLFVQYALRGGWNTLLSRLRQVKN